jgi:uncharacterized membrane protein YdcZ (DUF606 family)
MLTRIVLAICFGVFVALIVLLVGVICVATKIPILHDVGSFAETWCWVFGLLGAVVFFFTGRTSLIP